MQQANFRRWVKARKNPLSNILYGAAVRLRYFSMPVIPFLHAALYTAHTALRTVFYSLTRVFWFTPLFQTRLERPARNLYLYGGMPLVLGRLNIIVGEGCRISGKITLSGRIATLTMPTLTVGNNVDIGWNSTLAVGSKITIGHNVRMAGKVFLAGYPGHPVDADARAAGYPDTDDQIGDIVLEDDVWLATDVTVLAGVTIGRGTIVAAGSVVTHSLPAFVLAAGAPARVKKSLLQ